MTIQTALRRTALLVIIAVSLRAAALPTGQAVDLGDTKVVTPGTPVSILNQYSSSGSVTVKQLTITAPSSNAGEVFLMARCDVAANTTNHTNVRQRIFPGMVINYTQGFTGATDFNVANFCIDALNANDSVTITAYAVNQN